MTLDWKGIWEKTIVAVFVTVILAILAWIWATFSKESEPLNANITWVETPNPFRTFVDDAYVSDQLTEFRVSGKTNPALEALAKSVGFKDSEEFSRELGYSEKLTLVTVTVKNNSNNRVKDVDVVFEDGIPMRSHANQGQKNATRIPNTDPFKSETASFYSKFPISQSELSQYYFLKTGKIQVFHDNKATEVFMDAVPDELLFFKPLVGKFPTVVFFALLLLFVLGLALVLAAIIAPFVKNDVSSKVGRTTPEESKDYFERLEYARTHNPEKLKLIPKSMSEPLQQ
jgi:hypothetical protein